MPFLSSSRFSCRKADRVVLFLPVSHTEESHRPLLVLQWEAPHGVRHGKSCAHSSVKARDPVRKLGPRAGAVSQETGPQQPQHAP